MLRFLLSSLATVAGIVLLFVASFGDPNVLLTRIDAVFGSRELPMASSAPAQPRAPPQTQARAQTPPQAPPAAATPPGPAQQVASSPPPAGSGSAGSATVEAQRQALQQQLQQLQAQMAQASQSVESLRNQEAQERHAVAALRQQRATEQRTADQARTAAQAPMPQTVATNEPALPLPPPLPPSPPPQPARQVAAAAAPPSHRADTTALDSVLARLRQSPPPATVPAGAPPVAQAAERPPSPQFTRPPPSGLQARLRNARDALLRGNIEAARQYLEQAQLQLVFRPVEPGQDEPAGPGAAAQNVADALGMLGAGNANGALEDIDRAMASARPAAQPPSADNGYASGYYGGPAGQWYPQAAPGAFR